MSASEKKRLQIDELQHLQSHPEEIVGKIDQIFETLTDADEEVRAWAADCLQEVECLENELVGRIAGLCKHQNHVVVNWACRTLGKASSVGLCEDELASVLRDHPSVAVKQSAAEALCELTAAKESTKAALQQAAASSDVRLQRLAKKVLEKVDNDRDPNN
jgi:2-oxo-4-hydroxy-4-carboxy--5-ureidoimidazoline (OHCU) decarboxylase